jgi:uncharacterized membrane protein
VGKRQGASKIGERYLAIYALPLRCCSLEAMGARTRSPRLLWVPVRVLLFTILAALLSFALSLLLGILWTVAAAKIRGVHPDMRFAYRHVALPVAIVAAVVVVVGASVVELRHYRQAKTLAGIERLS